MEIKADIRLGDCKDILKEYPDNYVDLIVTSPPYADARRNTYGGIHPNNYVDWFLPISEQLLRVLKPTGTFILNIKERVSNGERHTYVLELILAPMLTASLIICSNFNFPLSLKIISLPLNCITNLILRALSMNLLICFNLTFIS